MRNQRSKLIKRNKEKIGSKLIKRNKEKVGSKLIKRNKEKVVSKSEIHPDRILYCSF